MKKMKNKKNIFLSVFPMVMILSVFTLDCYSQSNLEFFFGSSSKYDNVEVKRVVAIDTIELMTGEKVKLIGLNAPDVPKVIKEEQTKDPFKLVRQQEKIADPRISVEENAFEFSQELLEGQRVRLEFDSVKKHDNFQTLAYVFTLENNTFVNAEILRQGYAQLRITPPNMKYAKELRKAYQEARKHLRGLQNK